MSVHGRRLAPPAAVAGAGRRAPASRCSCVELRRRFGDGQRARRPVARSGAGRAGRAARPVGLRQDHGAARARRAGAAGLRPRPASTAATSRGVPANRRDMGMVFQAYSLFPHLTARENVAFGLRLRRHGGRASGARWPTGCSSWSPRRPRAIATRTSFPAASSSASRWRGRWRSSRRCCCSTSRSRRWTPRCARSCATRSAGSRREVGITTLFVTHDQDEALAIADRVGGHVRRPRCEQIAPPAELYERPRTRPGRRVRRPVQPHPRRGQGRHGRRAGCAPAAAGGIDDRRAGDGPGPARGGRAAAGRRRARTGSSRRASWARSRASRCASPTAPSC